MDRISTFIRKNFIEYFTNLQHKVLPAGDILIGGDTFFTIAGMQQFIDVFLGNRMIEHNRVITIQPCVRMGGKQNDLEEVGKTKRHHTFFEMLGNFSFFDYFKTEAIPMAYNFLVQILKIDSKRLFITIHQNDNESYDIASQLVSSDRIIRLETNFWRVGEYGPCGPCVEFFFNTLESNDDIKQRIIDGKDDILEIWNVVCMQFNQTPNGLVPLEKPCIDTGAGLERLCGILNKTYDNYKTDLFEPIIEQIYKIDSKLSESVIKMIADHMRTIVFLLNRKLYPSNDGAGYLLRKLLRRCFLYILDLEKLVDVVIGCLDYYLNHNHIDFIHDIILEEKGLFIEVLDKNQHKLENLINIHDNIEKEIYYLYETFGVPIELSIDFVEKHNKIINRMILNTLKDQHSHKSKKLTINYNQNTEIYCYEVLNIKATIQYIQNDEEYTYVITDKTCFYGRGGGQEGDRGYMVINNTKYDIIDTIKQKTPTGECVIHLMKQYNLEQCIGCEVELFVNKNLRMARTRAHSATHLLFDQLEKILGHNIEQDGSFVDDDYLRIDILTRPIGQETLNILNTRVNDIILDAIDRNVTYVNLEDLPIESRNKYYKHMRMVSFGEYSSQPCGGTHVDNTSNIGCIVIIKESSIRKNTRRIEALTGRKAYDYLFKKPGEPIKEMQKIQDSYIIKESSKFLFYKSFHKNQITNILRTNTEKTICIFLNDQLIIKQNHCTLDCIDKLIENFDLKGGGKDILYLGAKDLNINKIMDFMIGFNQSVVFE